jgi:hypothetical protein
LYDPINNRSTATINFPAGSIIGDAKGKDKGTFDTKLKFDLSLKGMTSGLKFDVKDMKLKSSGSKWGKKPPPNALVLPGVNDPPNPFWPGNIEFASDGSNGHSVSTQIASDTTPVPEPATFVLLGTGLLGGMAIQFIRRRRNQAA